MLLAKIADGPEVRAFLADNSHESQIAFTGQRDLAARKHANTVGIEQEADHQGGIKRWGTSGFRLVGGIEAASIQLRYGIQQEEHQVALGQLRCRALCLVPVTLRVPGPIRFPVLFTHPCSPRGEVREDSQSEPSDHSLLAHQWQQPVGELVKCFFMDSLLEGAEGWQEAVARAERSGAGAYRCAPRGAARGGKAQPLFERVAEPMGGRNAARQPSRLRGQSSGAGVSAAALTGPRAAALTGVPFRPLVREPGVAWTPRRQRLGGVCDGAAVDDGGVGPRPARPNDPAASALTFRQA